MNEGPVREWMDRHVKAELNQNKASGLLRSACKFARKPVSVLNHPVVAYWTPFAGVLALVAGIITAYCVGPSISWVMALLYGGVIVQIGLIVRGFRALSAFQSTNQNDAATFLVLFSIFSLLPLLFTITLPLPEQNNYNRAQTFEPRLQKLGQTVQGLQQQGRPVTLGAMVRHESLPSNKCNGMIKNIDGEAQCQVIQADKDEDKDNLSEVEKRKRDNRPIRTVKIGPYEFSNASFMQNDETIIMKVSELDQGTYERLVERLAKNQPSFWVGNGFEVGSSTGTFRYTGP